MTPKEFVDNVAGIIRGMCDMLNISYDKFIRTTDEYHEKQVQKIFKRLYNQGDIYKGAYEGMYCTPCESFWTESQLVDGKCPDCGREVKPAKEEAYFFRMSKYADRLIKHINEHPEFIQPVSRKNEMMNNFLLPGLQDLCVSRTSFKWGIPVDFDDKHVVYVWLDALTNYITGIGYDADGNSSEQYKKYWPADLHLIGKDIIRFHTIYWPIFLMALGEPLPKQVFGHPWLLMSGGKMSKSLGNSLLLKDLLDEYSPETVKFALLSTNYRADINITDDLFPEAKKHLVSFYSAIRAAQDAGIEIAGEYPAIDEKFNSAMDDDFNTALAISDLFGYFKKIKALVAAKDPAAGAMINQIRKTYSLLGLFKADASGFLSDGKEQIPADITALADKMQSARAVKDYAAADAYRAQINAAGYNVAISKDGYTLTRTK